MIFDHHKRAKPNTDHPPDISIERVVRVDFRPDLQCMNFGSSISVETQSFGAVTGLHRAGVPPGISTT